MYWPKPLYLFVILVTLTAAATAVAQEESKSAEGTSAAPKAASKAEIIDKEYSGHQTEEWMVVQNQVTIMKGRFENQKKLMEDLIQQKEITKGAEQIEKIEELKKAHVEYIRLIEAYNQLNTTFQTKFPERGGTVGRVYKRIDPATIEALQNRMSAEGRLQKLNKTIEKQYSSPPVASDQNTSAKAAKKSMQKKIMNPEAQPTPKSNDVQVTEQIILQK